MTGTDIGALAGDLAARVNLYRKDGFRCLYDDEDMALDERSVAALSTLAAEKAELERRLNRADRIIGWMAKHIGDMAPPSRGIADLNEHWLDMERHASRQPADTGKE